MPIHRHDFVERYQGSAAFGLDRPTDEDTLVVVLQKFSDDDLMEVLVPRLTAAEMEEAYSLVTRLMRAHLTDDEYHRLFLKDEHP